MGIQTSTPTRDVTFHARLLFQLVQCFGSIAGVQDGADIRPDPTDTGKKKNGPRTRGPNLVHRKWSASLVHCCFWFNLCNFWRCSETLREWARMGDLPKSFNMIRSRFRCWFWRSYDECCVWKGKPTGH